MSNKRVVRVYMIATTFVKSELVDYQVYMVQHIP